MQQICVVSFFCSSLFDLCVFKLHVIFIYKESSRWLPEQEPRASDRQKSSQSVPTREQVGT